MVRRFPGRAGLLFLLPLLLPSCYYLKQGSHLIGYHAGARSVARILKDPATPDEVREFLSSVEEIRTFAGEELGLAENENYTTYAEAGRDFLAYVVSAAEPLAFETHHWNYPFIGKAPYRGFYEEEDARREALKLKEKGLDVWVRRVDAFSTLGILKDPLYDYMALYPIHRLANLLIHEQTHATLWIKDDPSFNEDLASFVGHQGARLYIEKVFGPGSEELVRLEAETEDARRFTEDIFHLRDRLAPLYDEAAGGGKLSPGKRATFLRRKEAVIAEFQKDFLLCYNERYSSELYRGFGEMTINNAYLELFRIYQGQEDWFRALFLEEGGDMRRFLDRIRREKGLSQR